MIHEMIHRRHFLYAATLLSVVALSVPGHLALAQQTSGKPEVKISELRPVVKRYVDHLSEAYEKHTGIGFTQEEKKEMIEETIANMKAQGYYAYIDP